MPRTIGLIPAFEEEGNIGAAVTSLFEVGCRRVVVLDGAYLHEDGSSFLDGGCESRDGTGDEARAAGAEVIVPATQPRFGQKRDILLRRCGARDGDRVLFLDADERAVGELPAGLPRGHALVFVRNVKPNDLPDLRGTFPHGDGGPIVPLLRLLRWNPTLRFRGPGRFVDGGRPVHAYIGQALAATQRELPDRPEIKAALRLIRRHGPSLPPADLCVLPVVDGMEIEHRVVQPAARVEAKRRFYAGAAA